MTRLLLLAAVVLATPLAHAQEHGEMDHGHMDPSAHDGTDHAASHDDLMALHLRMMADPEIHAAMRADAGLRALMMPSMGHGEMEHGDMDHEAMDHGMDPGAMMAQMRERMGAMTEAEHADFMARFEAAHRRLLATPAVRARAMADPELRRMMGALDGMDHDGMPEMDHEGMDHEGMDHDQMGGMDHGGTDHAAGVAMQRRNAGTPHVDARDQRVRVGPEAFDASATADRFHAALAAGDRAAVEALLTPDAVVLEGGAHESRVEYLSHHFARDAEFLAGSAPEPLFRRTTVVGDAAWVASTQRIGGTEMAELLVMKQTPDGWRVAAVHWSSAR